LENEVLPAEFSSSKKINKILSICKYQELPKGHAGINYYGMILLSGKSFILIRWVDLISNLLGSIQFRSYSSNSPSNKDLKNFYQNLSFKKDEVKMDCIFNAFKHISESGKFYVLEVS
jgi:hypothetical protein